MKLSTKMLKIVIGFVCSIPLIFFGYTTWCGAAKQTPALPAETNAWLVYWDMPNSLAELAEENYDSISYFAAYFSDEDKLILPDDFDPAVLQDNAAPIKYLSVVNDVVGDNKSDLKSIDVVKRTLDDDLKKTDQADEIIDMAEKNGFNGIDLDYEQVFKDKTAATEYIDFIKILYDKASEKDIKLRVILEPSVKFADYTFPQGPQYVVMMYNLYGLHSGPGPKADFAFIERTAKNMKALPGSLGAAFANGGCLWGSNGDKKLISTSQAEALLQKYQVDPTRDPESSALYFSYEEDGVTYTVWFADKKTLADWTEKASKVGISSASIWRLGG